VPATELLGLPRFDELEPRVLAHRLQEPVPRLSRPLPYNERPAHQLGDPRGDLFPFDLRSRANPLGRLKGPGSREHAQATQKRPLGRSEHLVAPIERGFKRPMPGPCRPGPVSEEGEAVEQLAGDLAQRHPARPRRRKLDGKRKPVEPSADLGYDPRVVRLKSHVAGCAGTLHEQLHGLAPKPPIPIGHRVRRRSLHGGYSVHPLTLDPERLTARGEDPEGPRTAEECHCELCTPLQQVLAVIEDEERLPVLQEVGDELGEWPWGLFPESHCRGHERRDEPIVRGQCEIRPPHAIRELEERLRGYLQRKPRLPTSPCTHERHEPCMFEGTSDLPELPLSADEARDRLGQVVRHHVLPAPDPLAQDRGRRGGVYPELPLQDLGAQPVHPERRRPIP